VLEAMACGTPVVASQASAVPEAVGEAGLLADATDPAQFAQALERMLSDGCLREKLKKKGFARVREFSWAEAARRTLAVYAELI
jgi:glycosyltransferase involved in cell wall biosynthesis